MTTAKTKKSAAKSGPAARAASSKAPTPKTSAPKASPPKTSPPKAAKLASRSTEQSAKSSASPKKTFRATLTLHGKTATGLSVPPEIVESLGAGKRPPVRVTIAGHTYRSSIAPMGGEFLIGVSAEHRASAGVSAGDVLDVQVELDTAPREVTVPPDLQAALGRDAAAKRSFEALAYSHKQAHVIAIEGAKTQETRDRRVAKAIEMLRTGRK